MLATFFGTPIADVRAKFANLFGERIVAGNCVGAQPANRGTLDTAGRTGIRAFLSDHVVKTTAALGRAVVAGGDAIFGVLFQMMTHGVFP